MTRTRHIRGKWTVRHREPLLSRPHIYLSVPFLLVARDYHIMCKYAENILHDENKFNILIFIQYDCVLTKKNMITEDCKYTRYFDDGFGFTNIVN